MELKLNIYKGKEIEKTYTADDFRLMTGTCEDLLNMIDMDMFSKLDGLSDEEAIKALSMIVGVFKQFKPIMKDIFPELTDDEYKRTDMKEVSAIAWHVIQYTFGQLFNVASKN